LVADNEQEVQSGKAGPTSAPKALSGREQLLVEQLNIQMESLLLEIGRLEQKQNELQKKIGGYQERIDNIPRSEQELMSLTRDYEITRENYQSLLQRQMEAKMAENMEKRQKGEQFVILDPAIPPKFPERPNLPTVIAGCIALGLLFGIGLAFAIESLDASFYSSDVISEVFGYPVLATLNYVQTNSSRRKIWIKRGFFSILVIGIIACYSYGIYYIKAHGITINLPI
jgi:uncharacterized protein involved in exopolysaccharide biosynthesis